MEPWEIKTDDSRKEDTVHLFIIFCEDTVSEPIYFKYFETSKIKVNAIGNQKSKSDNIFKAIEHCINKGLMSFIDDKPVLLNPDVHIWCVYDRDGDINNQIISIANVNFNESINTAKERGINVAWSNDAFELWVLLHFKDVDPTEEIYKNRKTYYDSLTTIFKEIHEPNDELIKVLARENFYYKEHLKSENNFRNIVRKEIVNKTQIAIIRAKKLEEFHASQNTPHHDRNPCTMVHHLVEELLKYGDKEV